MIEMELRFPDLAAKLQAGRKLVGDEMVVALQTNRGMLFDAEGNFNGHDAWAPLVLRAGQALSKRGVLRKSMAPGGKGEAGPDGIARVDPYTGAVTVGTNVAYAALMNYGTERMPGGVMRAVNAKALAIPLPAGAAKQALMEQATRRGGSSGYADMRALYKGSTRRKNLRTDKTENVMFRKSVKIPARRFDTITSQDERDFAEALQAALAEVLRG